VEKVEIGGGCILVGGVGRESIQAKKGKQEYRFGKRMCERIDSEGEFRSSKKKKKSKKATAPLEKKSLLSR